MRRYKARLNKPARELFGDATRVRVRKRAGEVQVLPTTRRLAYGLPEGETIVDIEKRGATVAFVLPETPPQAAKPQRLEGRAYKWLALVATDEVGRFDPALSLRA